jgi:FMN-dependent oxidoreductase (nitrilotriacetate monooxygenase family)
MTMPRRSGHLKLGAFFHPTGNHVAAWMHPDAQIDAGMNFAHYAELARTAERGKFDLIFLADHNAARQGPVDTLSRTPQYMAHFEPTTLLSAIAALTTHIGIVATVTTSYNEPYNIARRFGSMDQISGGRSGWNVVTSSNKAEAYNFGRDEHFERGDAYERALEFVEVCRGLWDSYDDDAFVRDRATTRYFRPDGLHYKPHKGKHFSVRGPLNMARPPQGYPVFAQAGASETGKEFAARIADIVFTPLHTLAQAQAFSTDMKSRATKYGRRPDDIKVMPGLNAIVGRSDEEAEDIFELLQSKIHPDVGRLLLATELNGVDLSPYPVDGPFPFHLFADPATIGFAGQNVINKAREEGMTIRKVYEWYAGARGQRTLRGGPKRIADEMEEWYLGYGLDGFLVQPAYLPGGFDSFVDLVIPELVRRGLFRSEYECTTLRGNLGLQRPASRNVR